MPRACTFVVLWMSCHGSVRSQAGARCDAGCYQEIEEHSLCHRKPWSLPKSVVRYVHCARWSQGLSLLSKHLVVWNFRKCFYCYFCNSLMNDRLMAVEVCFLRRMLRISWTERKSNKEVTEEAALQRTLMKRIRQCQLAVLRHVLRRHGLENLVMTWRIEGRRARVRQRLKYLMDSLCASWKDNVSPTQLISASEDRLLWPVAGGAYSTPQTH